PRGRGCRGRRGRGRCSAGGGPGPAARPPPPGRSRSGRRRGGARRPPRRRPRRGRRACRRRACRSGGRRRRRCGAGPPSGKGGLTGGAEQKGVAPRWKRAPPVTRRRSGSGPSPASPPLMTTTGPYLDSADLDASARFYQRVLGVLREAGVPFLVGGTYAFTSYTGIGRRTKDIDLFVRPEDCDAALAALAADGFGTQKPYPHWLAKAHYGEDFVDLIYRSGNGISAVDDGWFERATEAEVLDVPVLLCPPEEVLWTKAFIMERERFDGADVAHLLLAAAPRMDWKLLLYRFGADWRILLAHL